MFATHKLHLVPRALHLWLIIILAVGLAGPLVLSPLAKVSRDGPPPTGGSQMASPPSPLTSSPSPATMMTPPAGLSTQEWTTLLNSIRDAEYRLTADGPDEPASYRAPNRAQALDLAFSPAGLRVMPRPLNWQSEASEGLPGRPALSPAPWDWHLSLTGYGYGSNIQPVPAAQPVVTANRLAYRRGSLTEWYVNDERGVEQGFILQAPPAAQPGAFSEDKPTPLRLELALTTALTPHLSDEGQAIIFSNDRGETVLSYDHLYVYDATGRQLPARLSLDPLTSTPAYGSPVAGRTSTAQRHTLQIIVDDSQARYPLTIDPLLASQVAKLMADDGADQDFFGGAVAISGDTLVVGAFGADVSGQTQQGAAYVFERDGLGVWNQVAKLTADDGQSGDEFGISVGISGDTIVVGAPFAEIGGQTLQGAAYIFERDQDGPDQWGQVTKLIAADGTGSDVFGQSVGIDGDTVVVGAYGQNSQLGAAYIFERDQDGPGQWGQVTKLTAAGGASLDAFGTSAAISGDTVLVGAPGATIGINAKQGAAYIFERDQGGTEAWGQVTKLTAVGGTFLDSFGGSVAISGDSAVIGATGIPELYPSTGAAYVFDRDQGGTEAWGQVAKLTAADGVIGDAFGTSVNISGDTVVVGAYKADLSGQEQQGAAYVYKRNEGGMNLWGQAAKLTADDGAGNDWFGFSVALDGDRVLVGAYGVQGDQGAAYVYELTTAPDLTIDKSVTPNAAAAGASITYTLTFSNAGSELATGVVITDIIPVTITNVSFQSSLPVTPTGSLSYTWEVGDLAPNQGGVITITGQVSPTLVGAAHVINTATITGTAVEVASGNNTAEAGLIINAPVLSINKTASPDTNVSYQGAVTYTVVLSNEGVLDANGVLLTDTLPAEVDFARWLEQPSGAGVTGDELTWNGTVTSTEALTFTFVVSHVGSYGDLVTNEAQYSHTSGSGSDEATFTVEPGTVVLVITVQVTPTNVTFGGQVTYTIVLSNVGNIDADNVLLTDTLPGGIDFAWWLDQPIGAGVSLDVISWDGTVPSGGSITFTFVADLSSDPGDIITNLVEYSYAGSSGSTGSDEATFTVVPNAPDPTDVSIYLPLILKDW